MKSKKDFFIGGVEKKYLPSKKFSSSREFFAIQPSDFAESIIRRWSSCWVKWMNNSIPPTQWSSALFALDNGYHPLIPVSINRIDEGNYLRRKYLFVWEVSLSMEFDNNIKEYLRMVFHWNSFDDIYQFLILHVRAFQPVKSIDSDDQTILMKEENQ